MGRLNRKNRIELAVITVVFVIAALLVYKTTILTRMVLPRTVTQVKAEEGLEYVLTDQDHIEQKFRYTSDKLLSAGMKISLNEDALGNLVSNEENLDLGVLHLSVLNADGVSIMQADYPVYTLADEQNLVASLPDTQTGWKDSELTIVLDAEDISKEVELAIAYRDQQVENTSLNINGEPQNMTMNICTADYQFKYWKSWSIFGAGLIYLLLIGTYLGFAVLRLKPEQVFLFSGAILAVLYLFLLPPLAVPDEEVHFKEAYAYSNTLLGKEAAEEGKLRMDLEDFHALQKFETTPSLREYDTLKEEIKKSGREEGIKEIKRSDTQAPAVTYLPGILGITLGRLLGLNGIWVICLGRICSILCYLCTMYLFIRWMPCGKAMAFIAAILPMTIQQCCSYSYDSVVIEIAFLYLAVLFGLLYKEKPIQKWQLVWYVIFMILLSCSKGGTYMPLCLLTMLIPISRFKDRKQKWMFVGAMALIAVMSFVFGSLRYVLFVASPSAEQAADSYLAGQAYGASGLLSEPMTFLTLCTRTLFASGDGFLETMLGMQLGWLNIFVSRIVIYGMLLLMILAVQRVEGDSQNANFTIGNSQKVFFLVAAALSAAMVFASMFMSWTPKGSITIAGIQGRYFLPLLPVLLLVFQSKNVVLKKDMSRTYMYVAVCLQCVAVYGILMSLERVL